MYRCPLAGYTVATNQSSVGQSIQVSKHLFGVTGRVDLLVCDENLCVRPDQVGDPFRIACLRRVRSTVRNSDGARCVTEEGKRKVEFVREGLVLFLRVEADSIDLAVEFVELSDSITESVAFDRSARGVGLGVEPEEHVRADMIRERDRRSLMRLDRELRSRLSGRQHGENPRECRSESNVRGCVNATFAPGETSSIARGRGPELRLARARA